MLSWYCCLDVDSKKYFFSGTLRFTSSHAHFFKSLTKWACAEVKRKVSPWHSVMLFACCHDIVDTMLIAKSSFSETLRFTSTHAYFLKDFKRWACAEVKRKVSETILFAINIMTTISWHHANSIALCYNETLRASSGSVSPLSLCNYGLHIHYGMANRIRSCCLRK